MDDRESYETESECGDFKYVNVIHTYRENKQCYGKWHAMVKVGSHTLNLKLDTGADCNVLPLKEAKRLSAKIVNSGTKRLVAYNEQTINVIGETTLHCKAPKNSARVVFKIVRENLQPILGREWCEQLGFIVRVNELKSNHTQVVSKNSQTLGCCKDFKYDIDFIENPKFKIIPARRIPYSLRDDVKKELNNMVKLKVIEPISEPTPSVSPMVIVKKGTKIRICMDPTELNKNIKRRHFPLKTVEEIASRIAGSKYFTKLDCQKGFWQLKVTDRTSKYLTFATPWGRFRYLRLPFGISSAPEVFSEVMSRTLENIPNCEVAMDDIFLHAPTETELRRLTKTVTDRLHKSGFTLNNDKCEYNKKFMKFLGHIFTESGYKADSDKIDAITRLKAPKNVKELQRVLGMLNYLGKFIKSLSELTDPLRSLLLKDNAWFWGPEQEKAFNAIKKALKTTPVLAYYHANKPVKLSVDASSKSMGACLMQDDQPVAYATRSFTKSQQNHPQLVKEAMAIRFACNKFHEYVYGKDLVIETDHKPLETIFKKALHNAPLRLQRILWDIIQYAPKVIYVKGCKIPIADTLSRDCEPNEVEEEEEYQVNVTISNSMDEHLYKLFVDETEKDSELQMLKTVVLNGWPETGQKLPAPIKKYATVKDEIIFDGGCLFKGNKIIVPKSLIIKILPQIHSGHIGLTKALERARQSLYWYGQSTDIKNFIDKCAACQQTQKANVKEPTIIKQIPQYPFQIVSSDIFHYKGYEYLLIADQYSGFFDFKQLKSSTATEVIICLRQWFSTHGIPEVFESDGGPQYTANKFKEFSKEWGFKHRFSSPHYPRSNGFAERNVQTAKNLLRKCDLDGSDIYKGLLTLRNTDRNAKLKSPAQRLFSRVTRSTIPTDITQLIPKVVPKVPEELFRLRCSQKQYADRGASQRPKLKTGEKVLLQKGHREWIPAKVISETQYPRSVIVQTESGAIYRRNNHHLRKTGATIPDAETSAETRETDSQQASSKPIEELSNEPAVSSGELTPSISSPTIRTRSGRVVKPVQRYGHTHTY
ncbi:uncharacterized protein K02A2.6-like [Rhagoletis pomonella]|uniref:uncharacterized protein K02A2.6-like n=1 Tax=Rhagoletis pomonella TaxID=28610 RepID=UPI001780D310|nr:uncharacterized protein K02A2.6-like [Rhagoletis pomonella]